MAPVSMADSPIRSAFEVCASTLSKIADYQLEPSLQDRLQDLGERKDLLSQIEHGELMALVDFVRKRSIESLEAKLALKQLSEVFPTLGEASQVLA
jgi:hypothetical protein